ncbi:MAG: hypothetical protein AB1568_04340 [Thermodesulfobacteriota bacterium]
MSIWIFSIEGDTVKAGTAKRRKITRKGCNEPFKGRYWCPKRRWFRKEPCPFSNRNECECFEAMCGCL